MNYYNVLYYKIDYPLYVGGVVCKKFKPATVILYLPRDTVSSIPNIFKRCFVHPTISFDFNITFSSFDRLNTLEI